MFLKLTRQTYNTRESLAPFVCYIIKLVSQASKLNTYETYNSNQLNKFKYKTLCCKCHFKL